MATVKKWPFFFVFRYNSPMLFILSILMMLISAVSIAAVPLNDNVLFAFERCKELSVDLEKGLLKESPTPSFDIHCKKSQEAKTEFTCTYIDPGSNNKIKHEDFIGGSDLGKAELASKNGVSIKFLIGKKFASYQSGSDQKVCAGIFIFEQDALKQKASSLKSDL